jgi:UDP-N-acetylmuramyl pentapeptide phosphotransferase/UDP-N-acetylglucosamine-1-phosphate transferase
VKFAVLVAMATTAVLLGLRLDVLDVPPFAPVALPPVVAIPLSVLWLIWLANVFNFMDGMDALAAGSGVIFLGVLAFWSLQAELPSLAAVAAATGAAHLGFLWFNRPPARVFMGDAGSLFTGALLGGLALALARPELGTGRISVGVSTLLMGTFVWDATYTIVRRLVRGDPMLPHRTHLYQRLAVAGWSHGRVRALYLGLAVAYAAGAVLLTVASRPLQGAVVAAGVVAALALTWLTSRAERRA